MVKRLFLTPPDLPEETAKRCVHVPDDLNWWGMLNAALLLLTQEWNYEQVHDTDLTPGETAAYWLAVYEEYLNGGCGVEDVRQSIVDPCTLEKTFDGTTWSAWANILACAATVVSGAPYVSGTLRIDPTDPTNPQWSPDGGTTWIDVPPGGPTGPIVPPPGPTPGTLPEDKTCLASRRAALGIAEFYKASYGAFTAGIFNTLRDINSFLYDINRSLFQLVYSPYEGILESALFGDQDFSHYDVPELDAGVVDALTCILQDNATADGAGVVTFDFTGVQTQIAAELSVNPALAIQSLLTFIQSPGLNAAGGVDVVSSYDCIDCFEGCIFQSFAGQTQGWTVYQGSAGVSGFAGVTSFGINSVGAYLDIATTYIKDVVFTFDRVASGANTKEFSVWYLDALGNYIPTILTPGPTGTDQEYTFTIEDEVTQIGIALQSGSTGSSLVENATIQWTGADPGFMGSPC